MCRGTVIFSSVLVVLFIIGTSSCSKKQGADTTFSRLLGNWKEVQFATDDNNNGKIDPGEIFSVESSVDDELKFNNDSTGVETNSGIPNQNFKWKLVEGTALIISYTSNDTLIYTITEVSSVDLTLTTSTQHGLAWYHFARK